MKQRRPTVAVGSLTTGQSERLAQVRGAQQDQTHGPVDVFIVLRRHDQTKAAKLDRLRSDLALRVEWVDPPGLVAAPEPRKTLSAEEKTARRKKQKAAKKARKRNRR